MATIKELLEVGETEFKLRQEVVKSIQEGGKPFFKGTVGELQFHPQAGYLSSGVFNLFAREVGSQWAEYLSIEIYKVDEREIIICGNYFHIW
jgi:hypothetical protein